MIDKSDIWTVIILLGAGTFFIRFSFLGLFGDRQLPNWALRLLRYVPVAVLPALVAPLVLWPKLTESQPDPARLTAACVVILVGALTKNMLIAIITGLLTLYGMMYILG